MNNIATIERGYDLMCQQAQDHDSAVACVTAELRVPHITGDVIEYVAKHFGTGYAALIDDAWDHGTDTIITLYADVADGYDVSGFGDDFALTPCGLVWEACDADGNVLHTFTN